MLPKNNINLQKGIEVITHPTYTYKLSFDKGRIMKFTNETDAMEQFIYKVLMTERYGYLIYNWNYGFELDDLFGKPKSYVKSELTRRISECLTADERIMAVDDITFPEPEKNNNNDQRTTVCVKFTAQTIFGNIEINKAFQFFGLL